ncbi:MAG: phosphodiester glycosidase family protein [Deltaproteobacteria bacterium]|nr:phosphodiester glycosidase family protein [Deltaproteobacteria bacterium]
MPTVSALLLLTLSVGLGRAPTVEGKTLAKWPAPPPWNELAPGLSLGTFDGGLPTKAGDGKVRVLRVDPARFELVLLNASDDPELGNRTVGDWVETEGLLAAINASMYQGDHSTSTAHMERAGHVNNPAWTKDNATLAFDPVGDAAPVTIIDGQCDDVDAERPRYRALIQSIRMLRCDGANVWAKQDKQWSHAAIGVDTQGRLLMIHARSPWSTHTFISILKRLPIGLARLQYAEGGPEASLSVKAGGVRLDLFGSYETGFFESDDNDRPWPIPNVVGIRARD